MSSSATSATVIVTTYEWPEALDVVLRALSEQKDQNFQVVVADDGSGPETARVVERWTASFTGGIEHAWQSDEGFRRARALNLGALAARGEYLVFIDGDSIPRRSFLEAVRRCMLPGWFVASKRLHMSRALSARVLDEHCPVWRWTSGRWVLGAPREVFRSEREVARPGLVLPIRDRRRPWRVNEPEFSPPYDAYGHCFGVWRSDFERVNGFEMRFEDWGGEDVDIAARLRRAGLRCGWPGPKATMLHLWHPVRRGTSSSNQPLLQQSLANAHVEARDGLRELAAQVSANRVVASSSSSEPV